MNLFKYVEKQTEYWFLIGISFLFFLLRLPSLFEPYWYGDEGIYETIGLALSRGMHLYSQTWDNKPPFLYLVYGFFGGDQFSVRAFSLIVGLISITLFYALSKKLYMNLPKDFSSHFRLLPFVSTSIYAVLFGLPLIEGNIANAENFMVLPTLLAALLVVENQQLQNKKMLFVAGIFSSFAFLFKVVGLFDFAAFAVFLFLLNIKNVRSLPFLILQLVPYGIGFFSPIILTVLYFFFAGSFRQFYQGAFTNMVGYVGYGNQFIIPQGLLILKLTLLGGSLLFLLFNRKNITPTIMFMAIWIVFALFDAFFAGRPYIHYLLTLLPSFSLFTGYVVALLLPQKKSLTQLDQKLRIISICFYLAATVLALFFFKLYDRTIPYYSNFLSYVSHKKDSMSYYRFFDRNTPRDYQLAQFIKMNTKPTDEIFIWGNNAQVYKLVGKLPPGRFTVAYHITANSETLAETKRALQKQNPKLIIVTSQNNQIPYSLSNYTQHINIEGSLIYERNN